MGDKDLVKEWKGRFEELAKKTHTATKDLTVKIYWRRSQKEYVTGKFYFYIDKSPKISIGVPTRAYHFNYKIEVEGMFLHELGHYHQYKYCRKSFYEGKNREFYADKFAHKFCPLYSSQRAYKKYQKWVEKGGKR